MSDMLIEVLIIIPMTVAFISMRSGEKIVKKRNEIEIHGACMIGLTMCFLCVAIVNTCIWMRLRSFVVDSTAKERNLWMSDYRTSTANKEIIARLERIEKANGIKAVNGAKE